MARILPYIKGTLHLCLRARFTTVVSNARPLTTSSFSLFGRLPTAPHRSSSPRRNRHLLNRQRRCRVGGRILHDRQDNLAGPSRRQKQARLLSGSRRSPDQSRVDDPSLGPCPRRSKRSSSRQPPKHEAAEEAASILLAALFAMAGAISDLGRGESVPPRDATSGAGPHLLQKWELPAGTVIPITAGRQRTARGTT